MNPWQGKLFANTVHVFIHFSDTKHDVSIQLMSTTGSDPDTHYYTYHLGKHKLVFSIPEIEQC